MVNILKFLPRLITTLLRKLVQKYSLLRRNVYIAPGSYLSPNARIGKRTRINQPSYIDSCKIGRYCAIGGRLVIRSTNHYTNYLNIQCWSQANIIRSSIPVAGKSKGITSIGNAVWIGDSVTILPGANIGNGAIVGAGSIVTKPIPAYSVAVGNPARVIKMRYRQDIIDIIDTLEWWQWSDEKLRYCKSLFEINLETVSAEELEKQIDIYTL